MSGAQKRIGKEFAEVSQHPPEGMSVSLLDEADLYRWRVLMDGPPGSLYAAGHFKLLLALPMDYPFKPPSLRFETKIYHPNVTNDDKGSMCLAMLKTDEWKPSSRLMSVLQTAQALLQEPNPDDAVETGIAEQYKNDRLEYEKVVKDWVSRYAKKQ